ncbi:hypothetical protein RB195_006976 [Necator americanus]|uniref:BAH domain protein n=1 Tax=Necator americanus TaxID=51031 RepID=A0ABR1BXY9_NECAM
MEEKDRKVKMAPMLPSGKEEFTPPSRLGEVIRAVCLDTWQAGDVCIAECYSVRNRQLHQIRVPDGRAFKSWRLQFVITTTDESGISDVKDYEILENSDFDTSVGLGKDGIVRIKSNVAISSCPHHESYEGNIFWSEEFGRVLAGDKDRIQRSQIYCTWVRRDKSDVAKSLGVNFRICDLLKPVTDESVSERCRQRLFKDQEELYKVTCAVKNQPPTATPVELTQPMLSISANMFTFRQGNPKGNGLCVGSRPNRLRKDKRADLMREYKKKESDSALLLFIKKEKRFSEAWAPSLGRVNVINISFKGYELKEGDWFYARVHLFQDLFEGVEPIFIVKKVIEMSDPLAYTNCFLNDIQIEIECKGKLLKESDGNIIFEHTNIGNIVMTPEDYYSVRFQRMVCLLEFNHANPYHRPWKLVKLLRQLENYEEFPMLSPECKINDSERYRQRLDREAQQGGRENANGQGIRDDRSEYDCRFNGSSSIPPFDFNHRCPHLEEALDIIDNLLDSREITQAIESRSPWLIRRMNRLLSFHEGGYQSRSSYYSRNSSEFVQDEESAGIRYRD